MFGKKTNERIDQLRSATDALHSTVQKESESVWAALKDLRARVKDLATENSKLKADLIREQANGHTLASDLRNVVGVLKGYGSRLVRDIRTENYSYEGPDPGLIARIAALEKFLGVDLVEYAPQPGRLVYETRPRGVDDSADIDAKSCDEPTTERAPA